MEVADECNFDVQALRRPPEDAPMLSENVILILKVSQKIVQGAMEVSDECNFDG